mmetsp:Transcript_99956/g.291540  ORF Transcript_99956/g.291540 Transcript_99956/m.291540 type:complete len:143 (+) Transcript_99956:2-430(+)
MFYSAVALTLKEQIVELDKRTIYGMASGLLKRFSKHPNFAVFQVDGTHHMFLPRTRCSGKDRAHCEGDVYHAKTTGPLAGLDGDSRGASLVNWLKYAMHWSKTSVTENVCHGTAAAHSNSRPFPMSMCDKSLEGKRLKLTKQ